MATIEIKGVKNLLNKLDGMLAEDKLRQTMVAATTLVHGQAKGLATKDTGNLAGSIHMDIKGTGADIKGRVYTNVQYAPYMEFGTGEAGNGSYPYEISDIKLAYKENWAGMIAQPYMYPALKMHSKTISKLFKEALQNNMRKGG